MKSATRMPLDICAAAAGSVFACQHEESSNGIGKVWMLLPASGVIALTVLLVSLL